MSDDEIRQHSPDRHRRYTTAPRDRHPCLKQKHPHDGAIWTPAPVPDHWIDNRKLAVKLCNSIPPGRWTNDKNLAPVDTDETW